MDERWISAGPLDGWGEQSVRRIRAAERGFIAVFRLAEGWHAIQDECPHAGASLADGWLEQGSTVVCALHAWKFDVVTGRPVSAPAGCALRRFAVKVEQGEVFVAPTPLPPEGA